MVTAAYQSYSFLLSIKGYWLSVGLFRWARPDPCEARAAPRTRPGASQNSTSTFFQYVSAVFWIFLTLLDSLISVPVRLRTNGIKKSLSYFLCVLILCFPSKAQIAQCFQPRASDFLQGWMLWPNPVRIGCIARKGQDGAGLCTSTRLEWLGVRSYEHVQRIFANYSRTLSILDDPFLLHRLHPSS